MIKVLSTPLLDSWAGHESGIRRVVEAYSKYLPMYDVELVGPYDSFDLIAVHAGTSGGAHVAHCHGLYWTGDYNSPNWEWRGNEHVINSIKKARIVTVPSKWVAETFERDMRFSPDVIGHGIEWDEWQHDSKPGGFVLWNKNRGGEDVCDPYPVTRLSRTFKETKFLTTFVRGEVGSNVRETGVIPHQQMKEAVQQCSVYLATTKETFGIGILEAMAAGRPVLGFAHGGIMDMVEHGVNGYLAEPNNYEDLEEGLNYCMTYGNVLGDNGREMAKKFTWDKQVEKVADVYRRALIDQPPVVDVIIPVYNKEKIQLKDAVSSAAEQEAYVGRIIVVDDGSNEDRVADYEDVVAEYPNAEYHRKDNGGVATARNYGISLSDSKYVMCLDSDDAIHPKFLLACVPPLEEDRGLGITYTGLYYTKPNGESGLSQWPGDYDFDGFLNRQNQVPTACVFRKILWERLGGYKQRYAPNGAGSEDAEFWLRAGAYGWNAKKVTDAGLFLYSWMSGAVSGNPDYKEADWLAWHPWVEDGMHPFASMAHAPKRSHAARQYDQPVISVIIPVGIGHEKELENALDSLESQTFRKWEVVVVDDTGNDIKSRYNTAYPYVKWHETPKPESGAGVARNIGVDNSRSGLIIYLDADDFLFPTALKTMYKAWERTGDAVYSGYLGRAFIVDESELSNAVRERIIHRDGEEKVIKYPTHDFDCTRALRAPKNPPYVWNTVTTLVPKAWHYEIGGFDENMSSWEDVLYWYEMAWSGKCFHRVDEPLMMYKFYSGSRRDKGIEQAEKLINYIEGKKSKYLERIHLMGCKCGGKSPEPRPLPAAAAAEGVSIEMENDNDYVLVQYISPNKGQHSVVGAASKKFYGYRAGGDTFLYRHDDLALQPHLFLKIDNMSHVVRVPDAIVAEELTAPEPIVVEEPSAPSPIEGVAVEDLPIEYQELPAEEKEFDLQSLPGVTERIAVNMNKAELGTPEQILRWGIDSLLAVNGLGKMKAEMIYNYVEDNYGTD